MDANQPARLLAALVLALAAAGGAQAKGSLGVGLTIVSSCVAHSAEVYGAMPANAAVGHADVAMKAGCSSDTAYVVSYAAAKPAATSDRASDGGDVVVTLTY